MESLTASSSHIAEVAQLDVIKHAISRLIATHPDRETLIHQMFAINAGVNEAAQAIRSQSESAAAALDMYSAAYHQALSSLLNLAETYRQENIAHSAASAAAGTP